MNGARIRGRHLWSSALAVIGPAWLVLAALAAGDLLGVWAAVGAAAVVAVLGLLLAARSAGRLAVVRDRLEALASGSGSGSGAASEARAGGLEDGQVGDILKVVRRVERSWADERTHLGKEIGTAARLFDVLPDPLLAVDADMRVVFANRAARVLLDERSDGGAWEGRDLSGILRHPRLLDVVSRVLHEDPGETVELTLTGGVDRIFEVRVEPLRAAEEDRVRAMLVMHDVTTARRGEQMRADFVANVSHEMRTPLSTLVGFIETIRGAARDDPAAQERFLALMDKQASRMARLVNDLLSLSRIEMNEHTVPEGRVSLPALTQSVADLLAQQAKAKGMAIQVNAPHGLPEVVGDADELAQLFQNLIENAIKYGHPATTVRVDMSIAPGDGDAAGAYVCAAVRDESDGIPREHIPRLTERFYRVDTARSREMGGTGLGLAIVKHVANRHRGRLKIASKPGKGSSFSVFLPRAR